MTDRYENTIISYEIYDFLFVLYYYMCKFTNWSKIMQERTDLSSETKTKIKQKLLENICKLAQINQPANLVC